MRKRTGEDPVDLHALVAVGDTGVRAGVVVAGLEFADAVVSAEETLRRLVALGEAGHPITTVVFPGTDHGIREFETGDDDTRTYTRIADGYQHMQVDWILTGTLPHAPYGRARVVAQPGR